MKTAFKQEIEKDAVMKTAPNRLLSELSSFYIISNSMAWKLIYKKTEINSAKEMDSFLF
ncbi:hypothetical protein [Nonlabens sp. MB-3u-79]|uniref:hypothetical protein n=1 Tax=Nonlabens sp. MB-3u-79 TaxID=2058134 RepID=UPI0012FE008D|nr:hypothetical protein [Nonlabens sp. MB-3u-79]